MSECVAEGSVSKMKTTLRGPVEYELPIGDELVPLNEMIGQHLRIDNLGVINCIHCGRVTKKSFSQGYCYPCFSSLAQCDNCIMSPEKCHFAAGTCREPEWGETNCMIDHVVYLANSSGLKVGITRGTQIPTRWIDQGAIQAVPVLRVATRHLSGLAEVIFKEHTADRTNWRAMLKGEVAELDMIAERERLLSLCEAALKSLQDEHGLLAVQLVAETNVIDIEYPVERHPQKVVSFNLDKNPTAMGTLEGIKGQYLMFDTGVINIRKYGGYRLRLTSL